MQPNKTSNHFKLKPLTAYIRLALASGLFLSVISPAQAGDAVVANLPVPSTNPAIAFTGTHLDANAHVTADVSLDNSKANTLTINQVVDKATLNWDSFNVAEKHHVDFVQPSSSSVALNNIRDNNEPSKIMGEITANGQVYLYNQSGFVFGKDAVVNTNSIIASTMAITQEALKNGITQQAGIDNNNPSLGKEGITVDNNKQILVEKGAKLHVNKDGLMVLAAPQVINKGSLSADKYGQIILAASKDKVYLQATDKKSPFHGLLVEVDKGGLVKNTGDILAKQGNVTLEGFAVNQEGRITATTSVNENGSIRLLAQEAHKIDTLGHITATKTVRDENLKDGLGTESKVTFSKGSVTQVIADDIEGGTAIDAQAQRQSRIDVIANKIDVQSNAVVKATGGKINMIATDDLSIIQPDGSIIMPPRPADNKNHGRIFIDKQASVDVSGTKNVTVDMARNVADISVQSYELRDAPDQKTGVLKGATISIDIRKDTAIVDTTGAKARVERSIAERLAKGGQIDFISSGDTIVNDGAMVNISGGSVDYQSGTISTTQLVTDYGNLVDISDADPKEHYVKLADNKTVFEQGYSEGQQAGSVSVQTPVLAWQGDLNAGSTAGRNQRTLEQLPFGGAFLLNQQDGGEIYLSTQNVQFDNNKAILPSNFKVDSNLPAKEIATLTLTPDMINRSGVQDVVIKTSGNINLAKDTQLQLAVGSVPPSEVDASNAAIKRPIFTGTNSTAGSYLALDATSININGSIYAPSGTLNFNTHFADTAPANTLGNIDIAKTANLNVSGRWINDFKQGLAVIPTDALAIDGGTIKMGAIGNINLHKGSQIQADAGAWLNVTNNFSQGKAGTIDLAALGNGSIPSLLTLDGNISAYGFNTNGALTLTSGKITIGKSDKATADITPLVLHEKGNAFAWSGFSKLNLVSRNDSLVIKDKTQLNLVQQNRWLKNNYAQVATNDTVKNITYLNTQPDNLRQSMALTLNGLTGVELQTGSSITADKQAGINLLTSQGGIYVNGLINAPAGDIALTIKADPNLVNYNNTQAIWLGSHANLQANGTTVMQPINALNRRSGDVLNGGNVSLLANRGYVITEQGSNIDVSGTNAVLDLPDAGNVHYSANTVGSNAGNIKVAAGEGIVLNGAMKALAGSSTNAKGRFDFIVDRNARQLTADSQGFDLTPAITSITQAAAPLISNKLHFGSAFPDFNSPDSMSGKATLSSDLIKQADFSDVRINNFDEVRFVGNVNLTAGQRLDINTSKISADNSQVQLNTAYLKIGSELGRNNLNITDAPIAGKNIFSAKAQWTDLIGATRWDSFKQINLSNQHDLRAIGVRIGSQRDFVGSLITSANLNLTASQVYPTTLSKFSFTVDKTINSNGKITIDGKDTDTSPLAANGVLNFTAPSIAQNGVLKAAFGTINLTADNNLSFGSHSVTSVSSKQTIPFGITQGGLNWLYPLDAAAGNLVFNNGSNSFPIQTKQLNFNAPQISMQKGSLIDVSGGGDLQGYEFQTGAGGTNDYLAAISPTNAGSYNGGFAIMPNLGSKLAPFDPAQQNALNNLSSNAQANFFVGNQIHLDGTAQLPAGNYTILPPRYALLSGAFLITPQANSVDNRVNSFTKDGVPIVSGYSLIAGSNTRDSRWHSFLVEQGSDIRRHSQYDERTANNFFTEQAATNESSIPAIPKDSGQISLTVDKQLVLAGQINSNAEENGRGAKVDISSSDIEIVGNLASSTKGRLAILDSDLTNLKLDSLLLGGLRSINTNGETDLNVTANNVSFAQGVKVSAKDLLAAAKNNITVNTGATLTVSNTVNTGDTQFNIAGDGALLRLSGDKQIKLNRTNSTGESGDLIISKDAILEGATLSDNSTALRSAMLAASNSNRFDGQLKMNGGSLNLNAKAIALGEVDSLNDTNTLKLSNNQLTQIQVDELQLNSQKAISLYGNVSKTDGTALQFGSLSIDAAGLIGVNNQGKIAKIQADSLVLQNTTHAPSPAVSTGKGSLELVSTNYTQGDGNFALNGFNNVKLTVNTKTNDDKSVQGGFIQADGNSRLNANANLNVSSDYITTTGGSHFDINATGYNVSFNNNGAVNNQSDNSALGGALTVTADSINVNTKIALPSGKVELNALKNDITLGDKANLDLAGRAVQFADIVKYSAGGSFSAKADAGKILLNSGSSINVNAGDSNVTGGTLTLSAPKQSITLAGTLNASHGSTNFDFAKFTKSFDELIKNLTQAGITNALTVRSRDEDITQSTAIKANSISLIADKGSITINGKIDAQESNNQGGNIALYAGNNITLTNGSQLNALGTDKGGHVLVSAVNNKAGNDISINSGSSINVSGKTGGEVILRAMRTDNSVAIDNIAGIVKGYSTFYAQAVKQYQNSDFITPNELHSTDIANIKTDTDNYMAIASASDIDKNITLQPSIEINYSGDLAIKDNWDLAQWRYNNNTVAGDLAINASGNLNINASITDGFSSDNKMLSGNSWSLQLVAGSDLNSANNFITANAKDLIIGKDAPVPVLDEFGTPAINYDEQLIDSFGSPVFDAFGTPIYNHLYSNTPSPVLDANGFPVSNPNDPVLDAFGSYAYDAMGNQIFYYLYDNIASVHTGTGTINLASSNDIIFKNEFATVYNAGKPDDANRYGKLGIDDATGVDFGSELGGTGTVSEYPIAGGDMNIHAGRNIEGAVSSQFVNAWLPRMGDWGDGAGTDGNSKTPSAWGVIASAFQQNIGSFGGGNVSIHAGGAIHDLSVMMPTTGKQMGTPYTDDSINSGTGKPNFLSNEPQINGGGSLQVNAGGDIVGGAYLLAKGTANLSAGGAITAGSQFSDGIQLVMGDGTFNLNAAKDIKIGAVSDAMTLSNVNQFYSYTAQSALNVNALSGDVQLGANTSVIRGDSLLALNRAGDDVVTSVYPASLQTTAFGGSIALDAINLFPAAKTQLALLAQKDINSHLNGGVAMYDVNNGVLPNLNTPKTSPDFAAAFGSAIVPPAIMHGSDSEPARIVTKEGDISNVVLNISKHALIQAGRDFSNLSIAIQNINSDDVSLLSAGRDIRYNTTINDIGILERPVDSQKIEIAGPGNVLVKTGRNLDLGAANGLLTVGNKNNANLPVNGANLNVLVGLNGHEPNYTGFIQYVNSLSAIKESSQRNERFTKYLDEILKENKGNPNFTAQKEATLKELVNSWINTFDGNTAKINQTITGFMQKRLNNTNLSETEALAKFNELTPADYLLIQPQLNLLISQIFFNELKIASNSIVGNENGFKIIDTLFPKNTWQGDLSLILSGLQTLQGGDINLFVPGGTANAGLAFAFPGLEQKKASDLGIIAQQDGSVNAFVQNDFKVNQSRVFTQAKGDILIWSGEGDVDAGRGSKSSLAVPETLVTYRNEQKNTLIQPAVSGSGIRAADINGSVYLVAPKGVVNAGEAGIGATNVSISATAVLGANNIQVGGGSSSGVPVVAAPPAAAPSSASSTAASVNQSAQNATTANDDADNNKRKKRGKLSIKLLGFG